MKRAYERLSKKVPETSDASTMAALENVAHKKNWRA